MTDMDFDELQNLVNQAHRTFAGQDDVPKEIWMRVRSQVSAVPQQEVPSMNTPHIADVMHLSPHSYQMGIARYLNLAASVMIVAAIAVGGWFAAVNLSPKDGGHQAAMAPATPVADASCAVPALTADEAIMIIKNPYRAIDLTLYDMGGMHTRMSAEEYAIPDHTKMLQIFTHDPVNEIDEEEWADTLELGDQYLGCIQHGTVGQVLALMDPFVVQNYLRDRLPLFMSEDETHVFLTDLLREDAIGYSWTDPDQLTFISDKVLQINPDIRLIYADSRFSYRNGFYTEVIGAPVLFINADGSVASAPTFAGIPFGSSAGQTRFARNVFFVKSAFDGQWYVYGIFIP